MEKLTDCLFVIGAVLIVAGIALLLGWRWGMVAGGAGCMGSAWLIARNAGGDGD